MNAWTMEERARVVELNTAGHTTKEIGNMLGRSREAVRGVLHRRGLSSNSLPHITKQPGNRNPPPVSYKRQANAWTPLPGSTPANLISIPANGCKWPVDVGDETLFCCLPRQDGDNSYCGHHRKISSARA